MYIHEAIQSRSPDKPYITRRAWTYLTDKPVAAAVKLLPTDSPDGCVVISADINNPCRGWQPTAGDLVADDWKPVGL